MCERCSRLLMSQGKHILQGDIKTFLYKSLVLCTVKQSYNSKSYDVAWTSIWWTLPNTFVNGECHTTLKAVLTQMNGRLLGARRAIHSEVLRQRSKMRGGDTSKKSPRSKNTRVSPSYATRKVRYIAEMQRLRAAGIGGLSLKVLSSLI